MPITSAAVTGILNRAAQRTGRVPLVILRAMLDALKELQFSASYPEPRLTITAAVTSTATVLVGGAGRVYHVRVLSPSGATNDVIVQLLDGASVVRASVHCTAKGDAEALIAGGADGAGVPFATDIRVKAVASSDGSSNPAAGDRPTVEVILGA